VLKVIASNSYRSGLWEAVISIYSYRSYNIWVVIASHSYRFKNITKAITYNICNNQCYRSGSAWIRIQFVPLIRLWNTDPDPDPVTEILAPKAEIYYHQWNVFRDRYTQMAQASSKKNAKILSRSQRESFLFKNNNWKITYTGILLAVIWPGSWIRIRIEINWP
jgi:hypothetical protein